MQEIAVTDIGNVRIGQAEDTEAATGCTVILCPDGAPVGVDVRGGGPASRETDLLDPLSGTEVVHAVVLSGGSAFGLDAAGGVMRYLEERGIGFDVGITRVPLVCQSCLFDLGVGSSTVRPDAAMGYAACVASERGNYRDGNYGAGTGASVGKLHGIGTAMKSGIGSYAISIGDLKIGAVVAVNAYGDVFDWKTGQKAAGLLTEDGKGFRSSTAELYDRYFENRNRFTANTTIGAIITNARFDKRMLKKIAGMTHNGLARAIRPVHTSADGDSVYAISAGDLTADPDSVGTLAADVMAEAILRAVLSAESAYGLKAACDL